jgi:hypothetical protein
MTDDRSHYMTRTHVLNLLSDAEVARVSNVETAARLDEGDEYLDLEKLDQGVRRADGIMPHMATVLSRKSVEDETWRRILAALQPKGSNGEKS